MPKELTHWVLADETRNALAPASRLRETIAQHPNLYRIGAVAPDIPYFLAFASGSRNMFTIGERLHDTPASSFRFLAGTLPAVHGSMRGPAAALSLGMLSHIWVDATFHPLVYYFSGMSRNGAIYRHRVLETYMDLYFSRNFKGPGVHLFADLHCRMEADASGVGDLMHALFSYLGPIRRGQVARAIGMTKFLQRIFLNPRWRWIAAAAGRLPSTAVRTNAAAFYPRRLPDLESLFPEPIGFRHPVSGAWRCESLAELARAAVDRTVDLFQQLDAAGPDAMGDHLNRIDGPNLYTGQTGRCKADMRVFDADIELNRVMFGSGGFMSG